VAVQGHFRLDYVTSGGQLRPFTVALQDAEVEAVRNLALRMLDVRPPRRPDLLKKVEREIENILGGISSHRFGDM
jgi:hypothetical protein